MGMAWQLSRGLDCERSFDLLWTQATLQDPTTTGDALHAVSCFSDGTIDAEQLGVAYTH